MTVRLENLSVRYGRVRALENVAADAHPGRITTVIGPNASGKTTLLRACIGAVRPANGCVWIEREKAHRMTAGALAQKVAYVAQRPQVSASFTVRQVIELGRYALPLDPARIDRVIEEFELVDIAQRRFPELSVGQQQRVTLARAFAQVEADGVLILDEPTSAMDLRHAATAYEVIRRAASGGATVIVALHDLTVAAALADDAWLLRDGDLMSAGPAREVLQPHILKDAFDAVFQSIDLGGRKLLFANPARSVIE